MHCFNVNTLCATGCSCRCPLCRPEQQGEEPNVLLLPPRPDPRDAELETLRSALSAAIKALRAQLAHLTASAGDDSCADNLTKLHEANAEIARLTKERALVDGYVAQATNNNTALRATAHAQEVNANVKALNAEIAQLKTTIGDLNVALLRAQAKRDSRTEELIAEIARLKDELGIT